MARKVPAINASSMADISFLLLIFFLITTSMDVNQGLARRLPPPPDPNQKTDQADIHKRELLVVSMNSADQLMVQGERMDISQLREKTKEFILNENDNPNLPERYTENIPGLGLVTYTKEHVISVQNNVETTYQFYLNVQNEIVAAYNEIREDASKRIFGKGFNELDEDQQELIKKGYPMKISEAEPKNYNKI